MNCAYCATPLPSGAMFCGECGRAVSVKPLTSAPTSPRRCQQCGSAMAATDIFCGECGFVAQTQAPAPSLDTQIIESAPTWEPISMPVRDPARSEISPVNGTGEQPPEESLSHDAAVESDKNPSKSESPISPISSLAENLEETRIVSKHKDGAKFVLRFSTGDNSIVYGSGLIGRNPRPEPGEYVDQLVRVADLSRSVSKTHLEFGQEAGILWIRDRFSGNGTTISEPETRMIRCEADRRYLVRRGSRVDIGEQFFIVS